MHAKSVAKVRWGTTLRYPYEVRDVKEYFDYLPNVKVAPAFSS